MKKILISINNISKNYTNLEILKNISFNLYEKEIMCLLGSNGAGKTTLSNIISTLKNPTSGDIIWNNKSIYKQLNDYRKIIGYCPQQIPVYSKLTILETIYFSGKLYGLTEEKTNKQTQKMIKLFDLEKHKNKIIEELSGGLKQRVGLARALLHEPKLLILDEPTVALDSNIRKNFWEILKQTKDIGVSIILTTHYLDEAQYLSDRIVILQNGEINKITTTEELLTMYASKSLEDAYIQFTKTSI